MELTERERMDAMIVINKIYGPGFISDKQVNQQVLEVLATIIRESKHCSNALSWLPSSTVFINAGYLRRILAELARRMTGGYKNIQHCLMGAARNHRLPMELAKSGN